jgi:hypothetical protein
MGDAKGGEKMRYIILLVCLAIVFSACGCGNMNEAKGDVNENSYVMKADNPQVREFNKQLGEISNEASAERAVNSFVGYVDSRLYKSGSGMSTQSLGALLGPAVMKEMARKEAQARNIDGAGICSEGDEGYTTPLIDIGTITDNVNQLGSTEGVRVDDETVSKVQVAVEQSVPCINPDGRSGITPLEASVIGYALVSGDDGTATQESVKIPVEKVGAFVERMTE